MNEVSNPTVSRPPVSRALVSRPLIAALAVVLILAAVAMGLAAMHQSGGMDGNLMFFDHDLSDSAFGWMIAIPILLLVGVIVAVVCAGAALLTVVALVFAAVITVRTVAGDGASGDFSGDTGVGDIWVGEIVSAEFCANRLMWVRCSRGEVAVDAMKKVTIQPDHRTDMLNANLLSNF